jgi:hypothetical protein
MSNKTQITDVTPEELTAKIVSSLEHTIQKIVKPEEEAPITLEELSNRKLQYFHQWSYVQILCLFFLFFCSHYSEY